MGARKKRIFCSYKNLILDGGSSHYIYKAEYLLVAFRGLSTVTLLWKPGAFCSMQEGEGGGAAEAETKPWDED